MSGLSGIAVAYDPGALADLSSIAVALSRLATFDASAADAARALEAVAASVATTAAVAISWSGFHALWSSTEARDETARLARRLVACADAVDRRLADARELAGESEPRAEATGLARDVAWRLDRDALENHAKVQRLLGEDSARCKLLFELWRLNLIINQLERLGVRGRDSAGLGTLVRLPSARFAEFQHGIEQQGLGPELERRQAIRHFRRGTILLAEAPGTHVIAFAHRTGREVAEAEAEAGTNGRELRARVHHDRIFRLALGLEEGHVQVMGHTRHEPDPINEEASGGPPTSDVGTDGIASGVLASGSLPLPRIVLAALTGDIETYPRLASPGRDELGGRLSSTIATGARAIAMEIHRRMSGTGPAAYETAFVDALDAFEGGMAVVALASDARTYALALSGREETFYIGLLPCGGHIFASELEGIVELADHYYALDGEAENVAGDGLPRGQVAFLDDDMADPERPRLRLRRHRGAALPLGSPELLHTRLTTRAVDRCDSERHLLEDTRESARSVRNVVRRAFTIHSRLRAQFLLGEDVIPVRLRQGLLEKSLTTVYTIGQGSALIAARAIADFMQARVGDRDVFVRAISSVSLSALRSDRFGQGCLVVAVSHGREDGATSHAVRHARSSGACVISIVDCRSSDVARMSDGVFHVDDGRGSAADVASPRAFHRAVVAGYVLALALADTGEGDVVELLRELSDLPRRMADVLDTARPRIRAAAQLALLRRNWSVVGSGSNHHAASEIRIKLSQLCHKSVAIDTIEDKKHIDLSSEPLVFVCAAGLPPMVVPDAVKEVAVFRAHNAAPIVVCDRGDSRFAEYALVTIEVPRASPHVAVILNALVGHAFAHECASAISGLATPLRRARSVAQAARKELGGFPETEPTGREVEGRRQRYWNALASPAREALDACRRGHWNSSVEPGLTVRLAQLLRSAVNRPHADEAGPEASSPAFEDLLGHTIEELTAGIDALSYPLSARRGPRAETTGIGGDDTTTSFALGVFGEALLDAGVTLGRVADSDAAALAALAPAVAAVTGVSVYDVGSLDALGAPTDASRIRVTAKTGIAREMSSRADGGCALYGSKRRLMIAPRVYVHRGPSDEHTVVLCPLQEAGTVRSLALLHVDFVAALATRERVRALAATGRYEDMRLSVTEVDVPWDDRLLDSIPVAALLTEPVERLAATILALPAAASASPRAQLVMTPPTAT